MSIFGLATWTGWLGTEGEKILGFDGVEEEFVEIPNNGTEEFDWKGELCCGQAGIAEEYGQHFCWLLVFCENILF